MVIFSAEGSYIDFVAFIFWRKMQHLKYFGFGLLTVFVALILPAIISYAIDYFTSSKESKRNLSLKDDFWPYCGFGWLAMLAFGAMYGVGRLLAWGLHW